VTNPQIFVSYSSVDRDLRNLLVAELEEVGIRVWSDDKLRAGESFNESIATALYESRAVVLISTADALKSDYVKAEVRAARGLGKRICEISVAGSSHPDLTDIQQVKVSITNPDWPGIVNALAPTLKQAIGPSEIFVATDAGTDEVQKDFVDWAASELADQGLEIWLTARHVTVGDDEDELSREAIDRAGVVLAVLSREAATSERFCREVQRALSQDDAVLLILYLHTGDTRDALVSAWTETFTEMLKDHRFSEDVRNRFDRVLRGKPAEFFDGQRDAQLMAQVAKGLRKRQEPFKRDERQEQENKRAFEAITMAMQGKDELDAADIAKIMSLPKDKAEALTGAVDVEQRSDTTPEATPSGPGADTISKFCKKCGTPTVTASRFCRKCGSSVLID
jgi:hypothetical protein